jgi:hypothetical protein
VEHPVKTGPKQWMMQEYDGMEAILKLSTVDFEISLADIYAKVQFEPSPEPNDCPEESRVFPADSL